MKISASAIVSNSDMMKKYKACRVKAEDYGKIFILKNNQPDAVLFSISEYERSSVIIEHLEKLSTEEIDTLNKTLPNPENDKKTL